MAKKKPDPNEPMEHHNIADFLRGKSSKILRHLSEEDKTSFIHKNGKPLVVVMSNERYERMKRAGVDINDY